MKGIGKLLIIILFFTILFKFIAPPVSADLVFPECRWDELKFSCNCPHPANMCANNLCPECRQYESDPRFYYLWQDQYCRKASVVELIRKFRYSLVLPFLTATILDLAVFALRGYRRRRELINITLANILSFVAGTVLLQGSALVNKTISQHPVLSFFQFSFIKITLYGMNFSRMLSLLIIGVILIFLETYILTRFAGFTDRKKVLATAALANFISLILGLGILNAIYPKFLQPRLF